MRSLTLSPSGSAWGDLRAFAREQLARADHAAWRRFLFALFALSLSFFLALSATALREQGQYGLAAGLAFASLILAGIVAVKIVPYLARRTALERWFGKIEYEFTREGAIYLATIAVISAAALNTGNNLLFIILACLLAGILVSGVFSKIALEGLELDLDLPEHVFAGQPVNARLTLSNAKWVLPSFSVTVSARPVGRKHGKDMAPPSRPPMQSRRAILDSPVYTPYIPHRASVTQRVALVFPRRGRYTQEGFRVSTKFPFGFFRKAREITSRQEILVLPSVEATQQSSRILPLLGAECETFLKGRGHDLYAIRDYQQSDPARFVDWKATAKAQQLKVREFTREDERRVMLIFDTRLPALSDGVLEQFEKAVTLCACLVWRFYELGAQMQWVTPEDELPMAPAAERVYPVLERLALIQPRLADPAAADVLHASRFGAESFQIIVAFNQSGEFAGSLDESSCFISISSL